MNKLKHISITITFIILSISKLAAQSATEKEIDILMHKVHESGIFNGNVLVVKNGKTVYQSSFGYANAEKTIKLNADYRFNIGSISKEFNAVGIMMLKEQGKLNLEDKVSKYIDSLPIWANKISIKNLLQYTSGLPDINWKTIQSDSDILRDMKQISALNFEPGTNYAYNNSNVFLQRRIIEKITGATFQKFVEMNMLQPCGMTASMVDPYLKGKNIAVSFNNDYVESPRQFSYVMSGWTSVTASDLYKWTQCLHQYKLISKASFIEILLPVSPNKQSGLGGGRIEKNEITEHTHHGSSIDFEALMYTEPADDNAIILLTNNMNFKVFEIKDAIKSILNGTPYIIPKKSLLTAFKPKLNELTGDGLVAFYNELKTKYPDEYNFQNESELNTIGYQLMGSKRFEEAITIFELNLKLFPNSANAFDSLGEAFYNKGDKKSALINYKKSLSLDANNPGAKEIVAKLESDK
ncbi:serine hydrolase [Dyadobacter sp. NIV53]|uniref:serine hydrolase n=1 Tax=Dyadobacter sp. NIV53 TaxID=2861765 RepID=UPI001C87B1E4|nr:serine hydrolase [Dyadobacter sp. NIV53]